MRPNTTALVAAGAQLLFFAQQPSQCFVLSPINFVDVVFDPTNALITLVYGEHIDVNLLLSCVDFVYPLSHITYNGVSLTKISLQ